MNSFLGIFVRIGIVCGLTWVFLNVGNIILTALMTQIFPQKEEVSVSKEDVEALALNIYHETRGLRGQGDRGWRSVAAVVFNRLDDKRFPKTIPNVVYQHGAKKGVCAFSWHCDGITDIPKNKKLYERIYIEAERYIVEYRTGVWKDPTNGAHSYHANSVKPNRYFKKLDFVLAVFEGGKGHLFYRGS